MYMSQYFDVERKISHDVIEPRPLMDVARIIVPTTLRAPRRFYYHWHSTGIGRVSVGPSSRPIHLSHHILLLDGVFTPPFVGGSLLPYRSPIGPLHRFRGQYRSVWYGTAIRMVIILLFPFGVKGVDFRLLLRGLRSDLRKTGPNSPPIRCAFR
ncbi:hypothetical protein EDB85DRAFT_883134 [Lactarius pseudohatsudake]|nr:hypothetical protein EDB85DRAFT_883134 [Lactarius pseudohatsudake]